MQKCNRYHSSLRKKNDSSPSVVPSDAPHAYLVDGLRMEHRLRVGVEQAQVAVVQLEQQLLALQ